LLLSRIDPLIDPGRLRRLQRNAGFESGQIARRAADDLLQRCALDFQIAQGRIFLRDCQVEARLRFMGVGNGGGADFEVLLGRFQLFGDRSLLGLHEADRVLRRQHVEIRLRHAQHQILLGLGKLRFAQSDRELALLVLLPVGPAKQRLRQRQRIAVAAASAYIFNLGTAVTAGQAHHRQQAGARLWQFLLSGAQRGTGARILRIVDQCLLISFQQIHRLRIQRDENAGNQRGDNGIPH
jgi:hypothetical protein